MGIIRLLLAIAVLNSHHPVTELSLVDGHEAVLAFFVISGFYMALILDTAYGSVREFYLSRFLTLYPMYVLALVLSLLMLSTFDIHPLTTRSKFLTMLSDPAAFLTMAWTSAFLFGKELLFSLAISPEGGLHFVEASRTALWRYAPLIQAWSLSLELVFYAMAPFLVRRRTRVLVGLILVSLALKIAVVASPMANMVLLKRCFPLEFWLFGCGILAYRFHRRLPQRQSYLDYAMFAALIGVLLVADEVPNVMQHFFMPLVTMLSLPLVFRAFKRVEFDRLVGKISYPFYLLHYGIIAIYETYEDDPVGWHILLTALAAAIATHYLFDSATESVKKKLRRRTVEHAGTGGELIQPAVQPLLNRHDA